MEENTSNEFNDNQVNSNERENWLIKQSGWNQKEFEEKILAQQNKFAGLLSRENAVELLARLLFSNQNDIENENSSFYSINEIIENKFEKKINLVARVWKIYAPKTFERNGTNKGCVCNVEIRDGKTNANLVLWDNFVDLIVKGKISRNSLLKIQGVQLKTKSQIPLELHVTYSSKIQTITLQDASKLYNQFIEPPINDKPINAIVDLVDGMLDVDVHGRLLSVGKLSTFQRPSANQKQTVGMVCNGLISDGQKAIRLVCWDENAKILSTSIVGSTAKVEGGYLKKDPRTNSLELHLSWKGIIIVNNTDIESVQKSIRQTNYPKIKINQIKEGNIYNLEAKILDLTGLKMILKCSNCGTRMIEGTGTCPECSSNELKALLILKGMVEDDTGAINITFFDKQALEILGLSQLKIDPQTALDLKREYLTGTSINCIVAARKNPTDAVIEITAKQVIKQEVKKEY